MDRIYPGETTVLLLTAVVVGVGAGFGAIIFRWLINGFTTLAFEGGRSLLGFLGTYYVILIPALGGLVVGPMIYFFAREAKGHGVPEVMEAVALRGGRIRPIVVVIKALASSICIGTGGSVGREGPIVQIGSALGSTVGQWLKMSDARIRNLVACGAAGGIAATFNAPIAGVLFALEVILGEFGIAYFSTVVVASVTASVVSRIFLGDMPAFEVPPYSLVSPWELPLYVIMGLLAAPVAVLFTRLLYSLEDLFDAFTAVPEYVKPAIGGLMLGGIGLFFPQIFGVGYETIEAVLHDQLFVGMLATLLIVKILATSLTIGSGGSGGVFAPSLFMGAVLGGTFGHLVHSRFPGTTATPGAYALVGMAAFFGAAARAPITAIIILFEMTGDYRIILPLMLATVVATLLAEHLQHENIYTMKLIRRGVHLERIHDIDVMRGVTVGEVMEQEPQAVRTDMSLREFTEVVTRSRLNGFPVLDSDGRFVGVATIQDLEDAVAQGPIDNRTVGEIMRRDVITAYPQDPLDKVLRRMSEMDIGRVPVVDPADPTRLVGMLRRRDVIRAYRRAILRCLENQHRDENLRLRRLTNTEILEIRLRSGMPAVGRRIRELPLPEHTLITSVRRGSEVLIAHGETLLQPEDVVVVLTRPETVYAVQQLFMGKTVPLEA